MAEKIFSEIPMRTWHWLGVNEAGIEENAPALQGWHSG